MKWIKINEDQSNIPDDTFNCLWCRVPIVEHPYSGSILDSDFPGIEKFTHFFKMENDFFPGDESAAITAGEGLAQILKEVARFAWMNAANAYRLYPDNKHTFVDYWSDLGKIDAAKQLAEFKGSPEKPQEDEMKNWMKVKELMIASMDDPRMTPEDWANICSGLFKITRK